MKRRTGTFMLAVVATVVMTAGVGATSAAAAELHAESYPADILGSSVGHIAVVTAAAEFTCAASELEGSAEGPLDPLAADADHVECISSAWGAVTVEMNGCKLQFKPGVETGSGTSEGTFGIGPAGCGPMTISRNGCTISVGAQSSTGDVDYETRGTGSGRYVRISSNASSLEYTQSGNFCTGGQKTFTDGRYGATWDVVARDLDENGIAFYVASSPHVPRFESARYPSAITGAQGTASGEHAIAVEEGTTTCEAAEMSAEVAEAATEVEALPSYEGCASSLMGSQSVSMNSCGYVLHVANEGPPYAGSVDVACTSPGDAIEISRSEGNPCTVKIGPQAGFATASFSNSEGAVVVDMDGSGFAYTQVGYWCLGNGLKLEKSFTDGSFSGATTLSGSNGALVVSGEEM